MVLRLNYYPCQPQARHSVEYVYVYVDNRLRSAVGWGGDLKVPYMRYICVALRDAMIYVPVSSSGNNLSEH